jgi:hypothetical protein
MRANGPRECAPDDRLRRRTPKAANEEWMAASDDSNKPPALLSAAVGYSTNPPLYFGYLNSGAAFSASLVVFIEASHLLFLLSKRTLTDDGDTAT